MKNSRWMFPLLCLTLIFGLAACGGTEPGTTDAAEETSETACIVTPPKQLAACTMEYDPVCGCDGKTYSNACMAAVSGVPSSTPGACSEADGNDLN